MLNWFLQDFHQFVRGVLGILHEIFGLMQRQGILELLGEVLVDGLAALENRPSILEALNLLQDQTGCIDLVFSCAVDGYDAFPGIAFRLPV